MTLSAGTRLTFYEILGPIGVGGMGEVYRARDTKLDREVAIKVLPAAFAADAERLARFEREARTASALSHPNIVTIYEVGSADGTPFIAMELVEGRTLREFGRGEAIPLKKALSIAAQIGDGLARAHAAGIVHRDLKPENVMVTRDGYVKILDFGLAKLVGRGFEGSAGAERATVSRRTEAGTLLGTVGYMSPEQASGEPADFRSDQFSLGAIVYEMLTGKRAFERATDAQTLSAIIEAEPEPVAALAPQTPPPLVWIVERCLAKDPEERYGSTRDLARDLAAVRERSSGVSGALGPAARGDGRTARAARLATVLASAAVLGVVAYFAGTQAQARRDRNAPPPKRTVLTFRRGYLTGARFAPDGQTVVYSASWDGKPSEVFTTRLGSTESRPLGIANAQLLAVSSTGELAISMNCDWRGNPCIGTLARVPLAGGAPREVLEGVVAADWSPDGKDLAVAIWNRLEYPIGKVLYTASAGGFVSSVRVSPDGNRVAFLAHPRRDSERGTLSVVDRAGTKISTGQWAKVGPLLWSPTGEEVFFAPWSGPDRRGVRLSGGTRSTPWIPGLDDVSREGDFLDGGMLSENYRSVVLARVPGEREERNLSWLGRSVAVELSADGRQILFYEEGNGSDDADDEAFMTFLRPTDGSDAKKLGEGRALALSPDQQWALVVRGSPERYLVLLPTGAGEARRLPGGGLLYRRATFFPDGRRILFDADDPNGDVVSYVQDIEEGLPTPIGEKGMRAIVVAPDGMGVAARKDEDSRFYFLRTSGQQSPRPIAGTTPRDVFLRWSSDGRWIYTHVAEDRQLALNRIEVATGRRERWKDLAPPDFTGFLRFGPRMRALGATVTPDGRFYAYTYFTDASRLVATRVGANWWK